MLEEMAGLLERDNKLDKLLVKTELENTVAIEYKKSAKSLKCEFCKRKWILTLIVAVAVIVVALIIAMILCRGFTFQGCRNK